jgi:predicted DNA binding CopG/RHH family protein
MKKEYDLSKMKAEKNPYAARKKAVGINLSHQVIDYFKGLADDTGIPYQKLIDLYLLDCVKHRRKPKLKWEDAA